jgi:hypothetical protein
MTLRILLAAACLAAALPARAYCIYNQIAGREVRIVQAENPDRLRAGRELDLTLKPGEHYCCAGHNLDCNPLGRRESIVRLAITIPGEPAFQCGIPEGADTSVKVTGGGSVRVLPNPRPSKGSWPYIVRVRTHDKDITGPRGLACPEFKPKGK